MHKFSDLESNDPATTPSQRAFAFAEEHGLIVTKGDDSTLLIDIDTDAQLLQFFETWDHLMTGRELRYKSVLWTTSRSGGLHVIVHLTAPMKILERLLLQSLLGSDPVRERISLWRYKHDDKCPSLLLDLPNAVWRQLPSMRKLRIKKKEPIHEA